MTQLIEIFIIVTLFFAVLFRWNHGRHPLTMAPDGYGPPGAFSCSCDTEPAGSGGFREPLHHIGQGLLEGRRVQAGGGDGLPAYPVFPGPQLIRSLGRSCWP